MSLLHKMDREIYVLDGESFAWLLRKGRHEITIDHNTMGQTCGILPVGIDSARVKTQGLKWDFGDVSTSNHLVPENPVVSIETDRPVLWTCEIRPL
ncbi:uncharacterized protein I303_107343 [Kwoniella dejecticola CBS 10117]|uniref:Thiamin pyrophosphokinase thiamin-binding domain-containing protein n=1 Tax=Kwoniella dejecticola CBS 10117 TaxID=1296121 RepID=A0AAJ8MKT5_9TREE